MLDADRKSLLRNHVQRFFWRNSRTRAAGAVGCAGVCAARLVVDRNGLQMRVCHRHAEAAITCSIFFIGSSRAHVFRPSQGRVYGQRASRSPARCLQEAGLEEENIRQHIPRDHKRRRAASAAVYQSKSMLCRDRRSPRHAHACPQDFAHNTTGYDGTVTGPVQRLRGVYSSVDIPKGTAISFVPARHIMHRSEFNRSKIWPSLAPLSPVATNHTRTVDLTVGECFFCCMTIPCSLRTTIPCYLRTMRCPGSCCLRARQLPLVLAALSVRSLHLPPSCPLLRAASSLSLPRPAATCRLPTEARPSLGGKKSCRRGWAKVAAICSCVAFDASAAGSRRS